MTRLRRQQGFTLAEIAIVLVIVGLLLGGLFMPLSAQQDARYIKDTQKTLNDVNDALLGFAAANGRLPCPAVPAGTSGTESFVGAFGASACTNPYNGLAPGAALGVGPTNASGVVIDAWGNPIHYALFSNPTPTLTLNNVINIFSTPNGIKTATMAAIATYIGANNPLLSVCSSASAVTGTGANATCSPTAGELTDSAVAVIYSLGKDGVSGATGTDEQQNIAASPAFVSHLPTPSTAPGGEFDDIVIWLSPNILYNRMIAAGQLP